MLYWDVRKPIKVKMKEEIILKKGYWIFYPNDKWSRKTFDRSVRRYVTSKTDAYRYFQANNEEDHREFFGLLFLVVNVKKRKLVIEKLKTVNLWPISFFDDGYVVVAFVRDEESAASLWNEL